MNREDIGTFSIRANAHVGVLQGNSKSCSRGMVGSRVETAYYIRVIDKTQNIPNEL